MKRLFFLISIAVAAFCIFSSSALASDVRTYDLGTMLDDVALNAAAASRTATIGPSHESSATVRLPANSNPAGYRLLVLTADYTHNNNGTLVLTITVGKTVTSATAAPGVCSTITAAGACTSVGGGVINMTVTGDITRTVRMNIRGYQVQKIVASHAAADGSDKITLTGYLTD